MPEARAEAIRGLARAAVEGRDLTGAEVLLGIRGIGPWTAAYVAMRSGDPDAFPSGDLGLRKACGGTLPDVERWRPWRAYAAMHLWSSLGGSR